MSKKITFLMMSKGFRAGVVNDTNMVLGEVMDKERKNILSKSRKTLPFTKSNYFDILKEVSKDPDVSEVSYIFMMSKDWMNTFCLGKSLASVKVSDNLTMIYSSSIYDVKETLEKSNLVIIRGNYPEWNPALNFIKCQYIFLPCNATVSPKNLKLNIDKNKCYIFVDDYEAVNKFSKLNYRAYIFKKPAMSIFYKEIVNIDKDIDIILVCSKTDRKHKRVDLFIDSLIYLDKITDIRINAVIVGDSSFHKDRISSLNLKMVSLSRANDGKRMGKSEIVKLLDRSKIKVCTSSIDANPRVISESLARDVPVLCAKDLMGGKFQINKETGAFFDPNAKDLAQKILETLYKLETFSPRDNCNKIEDAAMQILNLIK